MRTLFFILACCPLFAIGQADIEHYNAGVKAHQAKDYPTAISCYKKCLAANPENMDAKNNLGVLYYNQGLEAYNKQQYSACIEKSQLAIPYLKESSKAYEMIGNSYKTMNKHQEALKAYDDAIEQYPKAAHLHAAKAWVYQDLNNTKARLASMEKAVALEPNNAEYQFHCGKFKQQVTPEVFKTALANYNKAIELNPEYTEAYVERAAYHMTFQDFKKAMVDLKKAEKMGADVSHLMEAAQFELEMQEED